MRDVARHTLLLLACVVPVSCGREPAPRAQPSRSDSVTAAVPAALPDLDSAAPKLRPPPADSTFAPFRRRLLDALAARDTAFLYGILAPDIKNSFGGDDSIAGFKRVWRMSDPNTPVWSVLTRILTMGGRLGGDYFVAPYVHAAWPDSIDPFEHIAVTSPRAIARAAPAADAPPVGTLSYSIVPVQEWHGMDYESGVATAQSWARVRLPDGRSVWLNGLDVYGPVDWRAMFARRADQWVLVILVAGD